MKNSHHPIPLLFVGLCLLLSPNPEPVARATGKKTKAAKAPKAAKRPKTSKAPKASKSLSFAIVGDIMTHGAQLAAAYDPRQRKYRFRPVFEEVKPWLSGADITLGNLETTLPGPKAGYTRPYTLIFGAPDSLAAALKWAGFDILITANNHICDKGFAGLSRTLRTLDRFGIEHFGAYPDAKSFRSQRYRLFHRKGWKIALLSYTTHVGGCRGKQERVNLLYWPKVRKDIAKARKAKPDAIVVHYHYGQEYKRQPNAAQKGAVRTALRAGADVVLGGHPHVVQPFTLKPYRDRYGVKKPRLVAYSMGNFVSNIRHRFHASGGIVLYFQLQKRKGKVSIGKLHYKSVWVTKHKYANGKPSFRVLPIERYRRGKGKLKLSKKERKKMLKYQRSTRKLLAKSMQQARRYGK